MSNKLTDLEKEAEEKSILYFVKLEIEDKIYRELTGMKTGVMPRQNRERLAQAEGYKDCYMEIKQQVIKGKITEKQLRKLAKKACNGNQHAMRYQNMLSACFEMGKMVLEELETQKLILELKQLETTNI